jgi:DNA-binding MarR family transcriptional regulator
VFGSAVGEILEEKYLREVSPYPISVAQFHLLKLITLQGEHQVGEVAEFLGVSSPAASKSIDKLEGLGLVARRPSADDRRVTLLVSTEAGRSLVDRYEATKAARLLPLIEHFGETETALFTLLFSAETADTGFCLRCAAYGDVDCALRHDHGNCPYQRTRAVPDGPPATAGRKGRVTE